MTGAKPVTGLFHDFPNKEINKFYLLLGLLLSSSIKRYNKKQKENIQKINDFEQDLENNRKTESQANIHKPRFPSRPCRCDKVDHQPCNWSILDNYKRLIANNERSC